MQLVVSKSTVRSLSKSLWRIFQKRRGSKCCKLTSSSWFWGTQLRGCSLLTRTRCVCLLLPPLFLIVYLVHSSRRLIENGLESVCHCTRTFIGLWAHICMYVRTCNVVLYWPGFLIYSSSVCWPAHSLSPTLETGTYIRLYVFCRGGLGRSLKIWNLGPFTLFTWTRNWV